MRKIFYAQLNCLYRTAILSMPEKTHSHFILESSLEFRLPDSSAPVQVWRHVTSQFRIVFVNIPGPLCTATVIVPTLAEDDSGIPHILEHLIFCGSRNYPHRGYLDNLANRSLSTGTNAYTTEDHTGYTACTTGQEGLRELLPVFIDHILHPTLTEVQFVTEVFHYDGEAAGKGVVYSEMQSRENTEADLLDEALRRLLYQNATTYSRSSGGTTREIRNLTIDQIRAYHQRFYRLDNLTMILTGDSLDIHMIFDRIVKEPGLLDHPSSQQAPQSDIIEIPLFPKHLTGPITKTVYFPSTDLEFGSVGYAWRGPPTEDMRSIIALDVLFRYLNETAISPFHQRFVERREPWSSQIDFEIKGYVETALVLVFSGVPTNDTNDMDLNDDETNETKDGVEIDNDYEEPEGELLEEEEQVDLFVPGCFAFLMRGVIENFVEHGFPESSLISSAIIRHRTKIYESLEDDPHEVVVSYLVPDIIANHFSPRSEWKRSGRFTFGTRAAIFDILSELMTQPEQFWIELARHWLLNATMVEVLMLPSQQLGEDIEIKSRLEQKERAATLGFEGLQKLAETVSHAMKANEINLPLTVLDQMPSIPSVMTIPRLPSRMRIETLSDQSRPFTAIQVVETNTFFTQLRFCLPISGLAEDLRPYLVLFQELLFNSSMRNPVSREDGSFTFEHLDYRAVVAESTKLMASHEASVGFGNDQFSSSWLSEVFCIAGTTQPPSYKHLCRWLVNILFFTEFTADRAITLAKNLLSDIIELKRDSSSLLSALSTRLTVAARGNEYSLAYNILPTDVQISRDRSSEDRSTLRASNANFSNDIAISIFRQEPFLKYVVEKFNCGRGDEILKNLERIKDYLVNSISLDVPGFVQIAMPFDFEGVDGLDSVQFFIRTWDNSLTLYREHWNNDKDTNDKVNPIDGNMSGNKRKRTSLSDTTSAMSSFSPFPFPRSTYTPLTNKPLNIHLSLSSLQSSSLVSLAPCNILFDPYDSSELRHRDHFAMLLMVELLTRSEGILYTAVRGAGLAYDASVCVYLWAGQVTFEVRDAVDPGKALTAFVEVLRKVENEWDNICSHFEIETARAGLVFKRVGEMGTAGGVITSSLRGSLRGFLTLEDQANYSAHLYKVTNEDLRRVFDRYLKQFLRDDPIITILLTPPMTPDQLKDIPSVGPFAAGFRESRLEEFEVGIRA